MQFEQCLKNLIDSKKFNEAICLALDRMQTMSGIQFTPDFVETWIDFVREDIDRKKFTEFETVVATYKYSKYIQGYPTYSRFYEVIRQLRDEAPRIPPSHQIEASSEPTKEEREANRKKLAKMIKDFTRKKVIK